MKAHAQAFDLTEDGLPVHEDQQRRRRAEDDARRVVLDRLGRRPAAALGLGDGELRLNPVERDPRHLSGQTLLEHLLVVGGPVGLRRERDLVHPEVGEGDQPIDLVHVRPGGEPHHAEVLKRRRRALDRDGRARVEAHPVPFLDLRLIDGERSAPLGGLTRPGGVPGPLPGGRRGAGGGRSGRSSGRGGGRRRASGRGGGSGRRAGGRRPGRRHGWGLRPDGGDGQVSPEEEKRRDRRPPASSASS